MSDTDSPLSDAPSDLEDQIQLKKNKSGILKFFTPSTKKPNKAASPPPPKRSMTPPHEPVLADNDNIAFIVMFRSRFNGAFPKSLANFGPQEIERGVVDTLPSEQVEDLLCALLGLLLNRKQDVKRGHYNRALEEAIQTHKSQWPKDWETKNPLLGGTTFMTMSPTKRLTLLRTLILWSLSSSETVKGMITASYKQTRHEDDLNQPLSVQAWGSDGHKRRYFLIEGLDDTNFRVYRESSPANIKRTWFSVAGNIEELKALAEKLATEDGTKHAKILSNKMIAAIPRFEGTEEKRKRREYRQHQKERFRAPTVNTSYSMYEGRTRGKRMRYTFSDEEEDTYSEHATRRSTRNTRNHTPVEPAGPTITQSGRQVKPRQGGEYGESMLSGAHVPAATVGGGLNGALDEQDDDDEVVSRRPRRAAAATINQNGKRPRSGNHIRGYNSVDELEDEDDASEQDYGDEEEEDENVPIESDVDEPISDDEEMEDASEDEAAKEHMVVKLQVKTPTPEKKTNGIKLKLNFSSPSKHTTEARESAKEATAQATSTTILPSPPSYMAPEKTNGFAPKAIDVGSGGI